MSRSSLIPCGVFLWGVCVLSNAAWAQFTVAGLEDEEVYTDRVTFEVQTELGFEVSAVLNGEPVDIDLPTTIDEPDYYALVVQSRDESSGDETSARVQFIVRASDRGNAEWGLPRSDSWEKINRFTTSGSEGAHSGCPFFGEERKPLPNPRRRVFFPPG